jgi:hypothetical protein
MSNKKGRSGKSFKDHYKLYEWESNTAKRLQRHMLKHPEDVTAKNALARLNAGNKVYNRNRKSTGHICKPHKDLIVFIADSDTRPNIVEQLETIGFKKRGKRNKKPFRQGMARVR